MPIKLDNTIPTFSVIVLLIGQLVAGATFITQMDNRISRLEEHARDDKQTIENMKAAMLDIQRGVAAINGALDTTYRGQIPRQSTGGTSGSG